MPWLRQTVLFAFSSAGFTLGLFVVLIWLRLRRHSRLPWLLLGFGVVFYLGSSIYVVSYTAGRILTSRFHPLVAADVPSGGRTAVVIMGSGSVVVTDWDGGFFSTVDDEGAARVLEAVRVYKLIDPQWMVSAGGPMDGRSPETPSAITMRNVLTRLGVPPDRIMVEAESLNTHDEAVRVAGLLAPLRPDHVVLVTSEVHMRRAVGAFKAVGVDPIPAVAQNYFRNEPEYRWWVPTDDGLEATGWLTHEVLGIAYYWLRGWYRF